MYATRHAIERFKQRVAAVSTAEANRRIQSAAASARARPTPRWWTPVAPAPGLMFLYPSSLPGVCLLVRDGAVLTVFERSQCRTWNCAESGFKPAALSAADHVALPCAGWREVA